MLALCTEEHSKEFYQNLKQQKDGQDTELGTLFPCYILLLMLLSSTLACSGEAAVVDCVTVFWLVVPDVVQDPAENPHG